MEETREVGSKTRIKGLAVTWVRCTGGDEKEKNMLRLMATSKTNFEIEHFSQKP